VETDVRAVELDLLGLFVVIVVSLLGAIFLSKRIDNYVSEFCYTSSTFDKTLPQQINFE